MNDSFDVYIGNLSVATSKKQLSELFSQAGEVLSVWIKYAHQRFTYAFIAFYNLNDAKKACEIFDNQNLDGFMIKVSLSIKTEQKLNGCVRKKINEASVLLDLPKRKGKHYSKEHKLRQILTENLKEQGEGFISLYKNALTEMKAIPSSQECDLIKTEPEKPNLEALEDIVIRYYKP